MILLVGLFAISISPPLFAQQNADEAFELGRYYMQIGDLDKAVYYLTRAIQINPSFSQAYNNRGVVYQAKGYYDQAISDYSKAIELDSNYAQAYNNRAISYYFRKNYSKAWEDIRKAKALGFEVKPDFLDALKQSSGVSQ
jgi:tetratricopeptide (TPR) repeat protein